MTGPRRDFERVLVLVTTAVALSGSAPGCSFLFVNPPPPADQRGPIVRCTESQAAPVADLFIAGWQLVRVLLAYSSTDRDYAGKALSRDADMMIGAGLFALFATSSGTGFSYTSSCREARHPVDEPFHRPPRRRPPRPQIQIVSPAPPAQRQEDGAGEAPIPAEAPAPVEGARDGGASVLEADAGPPPPLPPKPPERSAPAVRQRVDPE